MQLKTAADVKRALATATAIEMIGHPHPDLVWNSPDGKVPLGVVRKITRRQTTRWAVEMTTRDGKVTDSWFDIERASDIKTYGDDTFTSKGGITYRIHP